MDVFEKIFEKLWTPGWKVKKNQLTTVHLDEIRSYIEIISAYCLEQKGPYNVVASRFFIGGNLNQLHLPEYIAVTQDFSTNKKFYLYLMLISCCAIQLELYTKYPATKSRVAKRIEFMSHMPVINCSLDKQFPQFSDLQQTIINELNKNLNQLILVKDHQLIKLWRNLIVKRTPLSDLEINEINQFIRLQKKNDEIHDYLFYSIPCLGITTKTTTAASPKVEAQEHLRPQTEKNKETTEHLENVNLNKEKKSDNPVTHSFEKMETIEDYQGGHRTNSSEDELSSHENALNELELNQITIDGENSKSIYRSNSKLLFQFTEGQMMDSADQKNSVLYPEWSQSKHSYLENFCKLYLHQPVANFKNDHETYIKDLEIKHKKDITKVRSKINEIYNEPLWKYRQKEGTEIDYDTVIKYLINLRGGAVTETNFYAKKKNSQKDISVYFLFDQSLSTDSWVKNHRVLDTIIDSLCLAGLLFENLIENIQIAGTWSATRHHCHYICYKDLHENWDRFFALSKYITPTGYTRLGPAVRHMIKCIKKDNFRKKILILLTDGKPTDLDRYEGQHGIFDIKKACQEAEDAGIFNFALTIGKEEKFYFSQMFKRYYTLSHPEQFLGQITSILLRALK